MHYSDKPRFKRCYYLSSAFQVLAKVYLYQLYTEVYEKIEKKNENLKTLCDTIQLVFIQGSTTKPWSQQVSPKLSKNIDRSKLPMIKKVWQVLLWQVILVIVRSLVQKVVRDQTIPGDIGIHSYRGSTTVARNGLKTKRRNKDMYCYTTR